MKQTEESQTIIETDSKSLNSLSASSGHSQKDPDAAAAPSEGGSLTSTGFSNHDENEEDSWTLWSHIINEWETFSKKKHQQLKELVRKGIPHHFRSIAWQLLSGAYRSPVKQRYVEYIKAVSPCEKIIRRDIARTYPEHEFFKEKDGLGQESLCNVMKAYSIHDREVGYCQGSAFIAGLFLMIMPEEDAFAIFVRLMQDRRMRDMFKPSMPELGLYMFQLDALVQELLPELHAHFRSQGFQTSMYASSWFLTLFTTALPLQLAFRIMDVFLSEGIEIVFRIAIAILRSGREALLRLDMEGMLKYFQKDMPAYFEEDPDVLMSLAFGVRYHAKRMLRLQKEYLSSRTHELEEASELKRLKRENASLQQRVRALEAETTLLADRLVRDQVVRAEEAESTFALERELEAARRRDAATSAQLERARGRIRELSLLVQEAELGAGTEEAAEEDGNRVGLQQPSQLEELARCLQSELVGARLKQAEAEATVRDLLCRVQELEQEKKALREAVPESAVAQIQEELIAVRLREAEASMALKELRHSISELKTSWSKLHRRDDCATCPQEGGGGGGKKLLFWETKAADGRLEDELMALRLQETESQAELTELRLRIMDLESQLQVSGNQARRAEERIRKMREKLEAAQGQETSLRQQLREEQRKGADLDSKLRGELMLARVREVEHSQRVAELTQKISSLECQNQELVAEGALSRSPVQPELVKRLQERMSEMTVEVMRLKLASGDFSPSDPVAGLCPSSDSTPDNETSEDLRLQCEYAG